MSPPTEKEQQSLPIAQGLTSLLAPRRIHRSLLAKMRSPASTAAGPQGCLHLRFLTLQAPANPCRSWSFHPSPNNERISMARRSIHLNKESTRINMTTRATTVLPSPRSHPTVRRTKTRIVVALPIKGATSVAFLWVLPHPSARRKRSASTAQPAPQVKAHGLGTWAPPEAWVTMMIVHTSRHQETHPHLTSQTTHCTTILLPWTVDAHGLPWTVATTTFTTEATRVLMGVESPPRV